MFQSLRVGIVIAAVAMGASIAHGQTVGMAGQYSESNGIVVQIPQNPPLVPCDPAEARCVAKRDLEPGDDPNTEPFIFSYPRVGNRAARLMDGDLAVGGSFTMPPLAFSQRLGVQVGQVLNNTVVQLDTTFTAAMPWTSRTKNNGIDRFTGQPGNSNENPTYVPPPDTRVLALRSFSAANRVAHGQNNGLTTMDANYDYREALTTTITDAFGADLLSMNYSNANAQNGMGFTGTMTILLDGGGRLYLDNPQIEGGFPSAFAPVLATNPVGDDIPGFNVRNAAGWNYTVTGGQDAGRIKAFGPGILGVNPNFITNPGIKGTPCEQDPPENETCNLIQGDFDNEGGTFGALPSANSTKFMFAWTTGTISVVRTGPRQGVVRTLTQTGMGYDSATAMGGRNVGLVAGSYTKRTSAGAGGSTVLQMNTQMAGMDLKFTPEPGATVALVAGLGLLGALGLRRKD